MNTIHNDDRLNDDARFDRLVDGELSEGEYRALLASLDDEPGGWRRCALAFLEAQALATDLSGLARFPELPSEPEGKIVVRDITRHSSKASTWTALPSILALAASVLFAFCLGAITPRFFGVGSQDRSVAGNTSPAMSLALANDESARAAAGLSHQTLRPVANLRLVMESPGGQTTDAGEVPVYEVDQDFEQFLSLDRPSLAPELVDWLRHIGHDVERQQQYIPAELDDGRQVIVPVESYKITPVSRLAY